MATALEILFEEQEARTILDLWFRLDAAGIRSLSTASHARHRPHVTLANVRTLEATDSLVTALESLIGMDLFFDSLGIFPGSSTVLFLAPRVTLPLLTAHAAIHSLIAPDLTRTWAQYYPGAWVPHCSLAVGLPYAAVMSALELLYPFQPLRCRISEVCAVDTETGDHVRLTAK